MKRLLISYCMTVVLASLAGEPQFQSQPSNIPVELSPTNKFSLIIRVKNPTSLTSEQFPEGLPWGRDAMILTVFSTKLARGTPLEESLEPAGTRPVGHRILLRPGEELSGEINLPARFPDIETALKDGDVVLFWSYQTRKPNRLALQRVGGMLTIPKAGL